MKTWCHSSTLAKSQVQQLAVVSNFAFILAQEFGHISTSNSPRLTQSRWRQKIA